MKWLFIIDPLERLNPETDTTYPWMREADSRGTSVFTCEIGDLFFEGEVKAKTTPLTFKDTYSAGKAQDLLLNSFDLILMRKEPPYDLAFHYATELLSLTSTPVTNSAQALRDFNEKLIAMQFPQFMPRTLVSADKERIAAFVRKEGIAVVKHLDSFQGKSVSKLREDNMMILDELLKPGNPLLVQQFLPGINKGDKRILMLDGKIIGAVDRMPAEGKWISNFGQGGTGHKATITKREREIEQVVGPFFRKHGILFAGLDVIDGHLTEINITCPTGMQHINRLDGVQLEKQIIDRFEQIA